ncbi:ThiF family adenylyltransferase [Thermoproteota archaeon]
MSRYNVEGFTDRELDYYSRQIVLRDMGLKAQRKLKKSTVTLVGVGGLGSPIAMQLASMGVGCLRLIDYDVVEISNLQRQHLFGVDQIGLPKVEAATHRVSKLNPFIEIQPIPMAVTPMNASDLIKGSDVVIGALDAMSPRYSINRACLDHEIPFIHGGALEYNGNISTIIPGKTACLECFHGGVKDEDLPTCATVGVHPSVLSITSSIMSSETVRILTEQTPLLTDKLMFIDLQNLSFETITLKRSESCSVCGKTKQAPPIHYENVTEICGREGYRVFIFTADKDHRLNLADVTKTITSLGFDIKVEGKLGISFIKGTVKGSIMSSGVTILEGLPELNSAMKLQQTFFQ